MQRQCFKYAECVEYEDAATEAKCLEGQESSSYQDLPVSSRLARTCPQMICRKQTQNNPNLALTERRRHPLRAME